jgi:SpoVK/Ycf46/Vps4 family AAA+-type ATPase
VLACTNCPQALDGALRRRFPCQIRIDPPDAAARLQILKALTRDEPRAHARANSRVLVRVARATEGRTGAFLAGLFASASAQRFDPSAVARALDAGAVADGAALLRRLGPLTAKHWEATGQIRLAA